LKHKRRQARPSWFRKVEPWNVTLVGEPLTHKTHFNQGSIFKLMIPVAM
jgi:hypothetical protein